MRRQRHYIRRKRRRNQLGALLTLIAAVLVVAVIAGITLLWAVIGQEALPQEVPPESAPAPEEIKEIILPLAVPFIDQREQWPTGCESVSATMVLQYFGAEITVDAFIDRYLPMAAEPSYWADGTLVGTDPHDYFLGDPRSSDGWGCYAPAIVQALDAARRNGVLGAPEDFTVTCLEGVPLEELCETYIKKGLPVLVWASIGMAEPFADATMYIPDTGEYFQWYYPMHCLVLVDGDEDYFYFNDPSAGKAAAYPRDQAEAAYDALGQQAVVIRRAVGE